MLEHADASLRADPEIVKATVRQTGIALQFAAEDIAATQLMSLTSCHSCYRKEYCNFELFARVDRKLTVEALNSAGNLMTPSSLLRGHAQRS